MSSRTGFKKRSVTSLLKISFAAILITCGLALPIRAQGQPQQPNGNLDADLETGNDLLRRHRYEDALKSYKRVNEAHGKTCAECLFGMAEAYYGLEAYKTVAETCEKIFALAPDTKLLAQAYNLEGIALQTQAGAKDQKKLQDAEAAFRKGLALNVELPILYYNLGFTLMEMGRDAEGAVELKKYIELQPDNPKAESAAKLIENPRRAREAYSPDFSITTSDGEYVTVDDLRGKVVLLDFWGTWCPPCVASVPALRDLQKRFAKEPLFKMISVSTDSDEPKWRAFTEKNQMVWTQYLDRDRHVVRMFDVRAFPTYILLDAEGIIRFHEITTSWEQSGTLNDAIKKYLKSAAKAATSE